MRLMSANFQAWLVVVCNALLAAKERQLRVSVSHFV